MADTKLKLPQIIYSDKKIEWGDNNTLNNPVIQEDIVKKVLSVAEKVNNTPVIGNKSKIDWGDNNTLNNAVVKAIVTDDSIEKILKVDRKVFSTTINNNTKKIASPFTNLLTDYKEKTINIFTGIQNTLSDILSSFNLGNDKPVVDDKNSNNPILTLSKFLTDYKEKTLDVFSGIQGTLTNILSVFTENNETFDKFVKKSDDEKKQEEVDEIEDRRESEEVKPKKSVWSSIKDKTKSIAEDGLFSKIFTGSALGGMLASALKSPLKSITGIFSSGVAAIVAGLPALVTVAFSTYVAGHIFDLNNAKREKDGTDKGNEEWSKKIGDLIGGSGTGSIVEKITRYGGAMYAGSKVGGFYGALAGGATMAAGDFLGAQNVGDGLQLVKDGFTGIGQSLGLLNVDIEDVQKKLEESKKDLETNEKQRSENTTKALELQRERKKAIDSGDDKKVEAIDSQISDLNWEHMRLSINQPIEQMKHDEYELQLERTKTPIAMDTGITNFMSNKREKEQNVNSLAAAIGDTVVQQDTSPGAEDRKKRNPFLNISANWLTKNLDWEKFLKLWKGTDYVPIGEHFKGKYKDEMSFISPNKPALDISKAIMSDPMPNILSQTVRPKTIDMATMAKRQNLENKNAFANMLNSMSNIVNNNTNVSNTNVSNKNIINRTATPYNSAFTGYGRGE